MKKTFASILILSASWAMGQDLGGFTASKNSFKEIFNNHRYAQPKTIPWAGSFFPYADKGTAVMLDRDGDSDESGRSPMQVYEILAGAEGAHEWEQEHHSCEDMDAATKRSCQAWWGHCNGWAAAAIKEDEPRSPARAGSQTLSVAEQKAIHTELWLSSGSLNAGWTEKGQPTGSWVHAHSRPSEAYDMFWDVTPKAFFLIFTNYVGVMKTGIVIDRFTGDEVWNQPVVGYRLLPIRSSDIRQIREDGVSYTNVLVRAKIYWANDSGIGPGHLSQPFNIRNTDDSEDVEDLGEDYEGRFLAFRLNFTGDFRVSSDGKQVLSAGRMVGDGNWAHQENSRSLDKDDLNMTHPDFIWLPLNPIQDTNGYGNPYMEASVVQRITRGGTARVPKTKVRMVITRGSFGRGVEIDEDYAKSAVQRIFRRDGVRTMIRVAEIELKRDYVEIPVTFLESYDEAGVAGLFEAAGWRVRFVREP